MGVGAVFQAGPTFPTFSFVPTFPYSFVKMPCYPYIFTLKCLLRVKSRIFPRSLRLLRMYTFAA